MSTTRELPTFLQQTGPSAYTLTLSASFAEQFQLCAAKAMWNRVVAIEAAAPRAGQNYGKALHLALEHRYRNPSLALSECEAAAEALLAKHFAEHPQPELDAKGRPEWRTLARALQAFRAYNERYPAEDFEVLGVEEPFEVALGEIKIEGAWDGVIGTASEDTIIKVIFRGLRDLRVKWHDSLWVFDTKTSREWSDLAVDEGKASFQFQGYAWVERFQRRQLQESFEAALNSIEWELTDKNAAPVGGVIGNYIISRQPYSEGRKATARDLPRDQFERVPYPYSDRQLDEWHERAMRLAKRIFTAWQHEEWDQNSGACAHWGRCEYYRLCWETDPDYRMAAALSGDYQPRTASPLDDVSNGKERE